MVITNGRRVSLAEWEWRSITRKTITVPAISEAEASDRSIQSLVCMKPYPLIFDLNIVSTRGGTKPSTDPPSLNTSRTNLELK